MNAKHFIYYSIFHYLPTDKNAYFNNTIYLGLYDETINMLDGKILNIIKEIAQHPCSYLKEIYYLQGTRNYFSSNNYDWSWEHFIDDDKNGTPLLECNMLNSRRKYKHIQLYFYNKNARVVKYINLERLD